MTKTDQLILLVCEKMKNQQTFGSTVFNKVLYYIDNVHFLQHGQKISDFDYIKQAQGPTPKPSQLLPVRENLILSRKLRMDEQLYFGKVKKVPINRVEPDESVFSKEELDTIESIIHEFSEVNGATASAFSHEEMSWMVASKKEELPLYSYLLTYEDPTTQDIEWAKSKI